MAGWCDVDGVGATTGYVACLRRARLDVRAEASGPQGGALTEDSVFNVGSIAKMVTAACLGLLVVDGAIDVDTPIRRLIPRLPPWGDRVTLAHLLHHTSGIPPVDMGGAGDIARGLPWSTDDALAEVGKASALQTPPGAAYLYNGANYLLVGAAVAAVAGVSLRAFAAERLFTPLGMTATLFHDDAGSPDPGVGGHTVRNGQLLRFESRFGVVGDGGLFTSPSDLARWSDIFAPRRSLGRALAELLVRRGQLNDGRSLHYAWGVSVRRHRGARIVSHGGAFPGYSAKFVHFVDLDTTVVVLANRDDIDTDAIAMATADEALPAELDRGAPGWNETLPANGVWL